MATYKFQMRQTWAENFEVEADDLGEAHKKANEITKTHDICTDTANLINTQALFLIREPDTDGGD